MRTTDHPARIRWGLCCQFMDAPIRFRTATHRYVSGLDAPAQRAYLSGIAAANAAALRDAVLHCATLGIGAFRINSQVAPLATHPVSGYRLDGLDGAGSLLEAFRAAGALARDRDIRLSFHPDQFVVLNSERDDVVRSSVAELELQAELASLVGADVICLHAGGAAGGVEAALARLERGIDRLSAGARSRLALENDDRSFAPRDLAPLCARTGVPMIYDAHHHRCRPDGLTVAEATELAAATWGAREPYFHLSSPRDGWDASNPRPQADYIDPADFPDAWHGRALTVDVEAKDKERAVLRIKGEVEKRRQGTGHRERERERERTRRGKSGRH